MANNDLAYWISPKGKVMEPTMYHIGSVIGNPKKFGESDATIKDTFDKYDEIVSKNSEGQARNDIMERVMERGFIRIRKHNLRRMQKWVVELYNMNNKKAVYISNWARWMIDKKQTDDMYADVKITDLKDFRGVEKDLTTLSKMFHECLVTRTGGMIVYEGSLNNLAEGIGEVYDIEVGKGDDVVESWDDWITYAGSIDIQDLSGRVLSEVYARKISGGC